MVKLLSRAGGRKALSPSSFHCLTDRLFLVDGSHKFGVKAMEA